MTQTDHNKKFRANSCSSRCINNYGDARTTVKRLLEQKQVAHEALDHAILLFDELRALGFIGGVGPWADADAEVERNIKPIRDALALLEAKP